MSYEDKDALLYLADVRIDELQAENAKLSSLCADAIRLLNVFCGSVENAKQRGCVAWPDPDQQCLLRDLEDKANELGVME